MKIKLLILYMFLLCVIIINYIQVKATNLNLLGKIIYIDPGHGGRDSGATYKNIYEKNINLTISKEIQKYLLSKGAEVYLTRDSDIDLSTTNKNKKRSDLTNRAKKINDSKADMYISIHLNSITNSKWQGLQVFYNSKNKENELIADSITTYLKKEINNIRDYKQENKYYMYKQIDLPGVLIELGFISNPNDRYKLTNKEYQTKLSISIANAVENYFLNNKKI